MCIPFLGIFVCVFCDYFIMHAYYILGVAQKFSKHTKSKHLKISKFSRRNYYNRLNVYKYNCRVLHYIAMFSNPKIWKKKDTLIVYLNKMRASILIYAYKMYESSYESENAKDKIIMYFKS